MRDRFAERPSQLPNGRDRWKDRNDRWDNWHDRHYDHHDHWHHGHWHGYWGPGSYWNYWWDRYPALTAFGLTTWGINRVGWAFGYSQYENPYAVDTVVVDNSVYNYSQPIVMTPDEQSLAGDPNDTSPSPDPSPEALSYFDQARQEFYAGDYESALNSTNSALKELPNDTVIHEFRALVLFALGKYSDSAATLYAVLSVGPGWDWTTLSGLYPSVDVYTQHFRALEGFCKENPDDPAGLFVLAYHYMTAGHDDAATKQLTKLLRITPNDQLAKQLLLELDPEAQVPEPPKKVEPPKPDAKVAEAELQGNWIAKRDSDSFDMALKDDGTFSWKYSGNGQMQEVTGVWEVDKDGILALEMNDEGVMLAQVILKGSQLNFYMLGDTQGSDPLNFRKG